MTGGTDGISALTRESNSLTNFLCRLHVGGELLAAESDVHSGRRGLRRVAEQLAGNYYSHSHVKYSSNYAVTGSSATTRWLGIVRVFPQLLLSAYQINRLLLYCSYDLPAVIEYVSETTRRAQVYYMGHSQGTLIGFACSRTTRCSRAA